MVLVNSMNYTKRHCYFAIDNCWHVCEVRLVGAF